MFYIGSQLKRRAAEGKKKSEGKGGMEYGKNSVIERESSSEGLHSDRTGGDDPGF